MTASARDRRTATAIRFRPDLHERIAAAATDRDLSINWLVNRAVEAFLDQLLPVDQIVLTRDQLEQVLDQRIEGSS